MKKLLLTFSLAAMLLSAKAQTNIYYVNLNGKVGNEASVLGATNVTAVTPGALTRGSGLRLYAAGTGEGTLTLANGFTSTTAIFDQAAQDYATDSTQAIINNQYFEFSFTVGTVGASDDLDLTTLRAKLRRSAAGSKTFMWKYSINGAGYNFIPSSMVTLPDAASTTGGVQQTDVSLTGITKLQNLPSNTVLSFRVYHWGATTNTGSFAVGRSLSTSEHSFQILGITTLPVSLTSFTAKANKQGAVNLAWSTASEQDNSHFEVTRSVNGVDFEKIAEVKGNGNSDVVSKYTYTDTKPVAGTNYYRLKQIDFNGDFAYSAIATAKVGLGSDNLTVAVAANKSAVTVNYKATVGGKAHFGIYNSTGVKLASVEQTVTAGLNQIRIPANLGNSIHILNVSQAGATASIKF